MLLAKKEEPDVCYCPLAGGSSFIFIQSERGQRGGKLDHDFMSLLDHVMSLLFILQMSRRYAFTAINLLSFNPPSVSLSFSFQVKF